MCSVLKTVMSSKAQSYRRNRKAKCTQFKKGNKYNIKYQLEVSDPSADPEGSNDDSPIRVSRPSLAEYSDACQIAAKEETVCRTNILPTKLRPAIKPTECNNLNLDSTSNEENIIVNLQKLSSLVSGSVHQCDDPSYAVKLVKREGLCITAETVCNCCGFKSEPCKLFTTIKKRRGPEAGSLNDALAIAILKSKMGISDVRCLLSCMNVQPPAVSGLHKKLCDMSDKMIELNTCSMTENQQYVKKVMQMAGKEAEVNVETDLAFNNRPQSGYESATQSFCPMIEQDTHKKLVLSMATANKLCIKKSCDHKNINCQKNFGTAESISSSESKLVHQNLECIDNKGILKVKSVTSDASAQIEKTIRNYACEKKRKIQQYKCFVHKLRTVQKHIRNTRLTTKLPGCDKEIYSLRLSIAVRARVRLELVRIKSHFKSAVMFVKNAQVAIRNILPCFSGNHMNCRKDSMVCNAHLESYNTNFLPYNRHIELNIVDMLQLQTVMQSDFSQENLEKISRLTTTNRSESLHHRVFTYAPKCTVWCRNFQGLCHSAVHSATMGTGQSALQIAAKAGIRYKRTDPFFKQMESMDSRNNYQSKRKNSLQYKLSRHLARKRKCGQKLKDNSLYTTATASVSNEHAYGINLNK